jgi:ribose transport system permease protein
MSEEKETKAKKAPKITWAKVGEFFKLSWKKATFAYIFIIMFIVFVCVTPSFRWGNVANLLTHSSTLGIIAIGMGLIMISGDIDLSVGSNFAFTGGIAILTYNAVVGDAGTHTGLGMFVAFLVCLAVGGAIGFINGALIGKLKMPAFIATLGTMLIFRSLCKFILKSIPTKATGQQLQTYQIYNYGTSPFYTLGNVDVFGRSSNLIIPLTGFIFIVMIVLVAIFASKTKAGRRIYAVGSNSKAASLAGVNVPWARVWIFTGAGAMVGLAAFIHMAIYGSMDSSTAGQNYELYAIASCIIGGIAMTGGSGNIVGILFGTMSFQIIDKIIAALQLNPLINDTIKGAILLLAVILQSLSFGSMAAYFKKLFNRHMRGKDTGKAVPESAAASEQAPAEPGQAPAEPEKEPAEPEKAAEEPEKKDSKK